jgi:uncharacterized protein (DUF433 family)
MFDRIVVDPRIHFGKPCIAGTRITVQSVLELLGRGLTFEQIVQDCYPDLTADDNTCLRGVCYRAGGQRREVHLTTATA